MPPKGGRKHPEQALISLNTKNILFICGGAFEGIVPIIKRRIGKNPVGFDAEMKINGQREEELLSHIEPDDLLKYGLIPELIGRLPVVSALHPLTREGMRQILTEPKNAITKQYQKLFAMEEVLLEFSGEALDAIVERALARGTGARALRSIVEKSMLDVMFKLPSQEAITNVYITGDTIEKGAEPMMTYHEQKKLA